MSWNEQQARERVASHDFSDFEINVADLSRTMDFANLSTRDVRRVEGAHIYADIPNFHLAVDDAGADKQKQKKLVRAASVLRKMQGDLLREQEIGKIQLQAARLHALCFKPYDDEAQRAKQAVILGITLNSYLYDVFNDVFKDVPDFHGAVGIAAGKSYIANIGFHGDRERICLGSCANLGAKVINGRDSITITENVYSLLPDCLKKQFQVSRTIAGTKTYQAVGLRWSKHADLAEELGVGFDAEKLKVRTEAYRDELPLSEMEITDATVLIDMEQRSERNSKRTSVVALYADIDGFTKHVQEAENDGSVISLVRQFHMIRSEFHAVSQQDYPGLVLQHQGDRTFGIVHLPAGDDEHSKRCRKGLNVAIGIQSSMEHVLNERLSELDLHVAVGLDVGTALVTRLGKKGKREAVCLGPEVTSAERLQLRAAGKQIRISKAIFDALDNDILKAEFTKDGDDAYVADGLTFPKLDEQKEEAAARSGSLGASVEGDRVEVVTSNRQPNKPWGNTKPWYSR